MSDDQSPILTLEPLVDAVRAGVEAAGWSLSGLQKTTSHQFEGRWAGDSTRSAYLFFHREGGAEWASVDVFLDETSQGLSGNLALVIDAVSLGEMGDVSRALSALSDLNAGVMAQQSRTPLTLRLHLPSHETPVDEAEAEIRFKLRIPRVILTAGVGAVSQLAGDAVRRFDLLVVAPTLRPFLAH